MQGKFFVKGLKLFERTQWDEFDIDDWEDKLEDFENQLDGSSGSVKYFPEWIKKFFGLDWNPLLTIKSDLSGVSYHWQDFTKPLYEPLGGDEGLQWNMLRWTDNP